MNAERDKNKIKKMIKFEDGRKDCVGGGQSCGMIDTSIDLILEELDIRIHVGISRSQLKNRELAMKMLDIVLDNEY